MKLHFVRHGEAVNGYYRGLAPIEMWHTPVANGEILTFNTDDFS